MYEKNVFIVLRTISPNLVFDVPFATSLSKVKLSRCSIKPFTRVVSDAVVAGELVFDTSANRITDLLSVFLVFYSGGGGGGSDCRGIPTCFKSFHPLYLVVRAGYISPSS